ncbi:MAG: class I SAM-dependent methyltransferase [Gemmatimonadetes bacterium]|nr:class I SAM-dependent methyltransferase [Gemmatimonadota bacterium]MYK66897.1 class I SAM-dependent methyltransferase [Gemmatimonadota bacterium]
MHEDIFDFDGNYGERYEALARRVIPGYRTLFPMFTALIEPELPRRGRVLVVGAGTGIEIVHLKRARPDLRVHGVDPSDQMLELAERRVAEAGVSDGVTLQLGYAADVPTSPLFDAATLINVLHFVPDDGGKAALLADIARRLKPGAVFVFFDLHGGDTPEEHERYLSAWRRYWKIRDMSPEEMRDFNDRIREGIHFSPASRSLELALAAGFAEPERFYRSLLYGGWTLRRTRQRPVTPPAP